MADMAGIAQVEAAWDALDRRRASRGSTVPVTYMNSSAAIKGFVGRHGGVVCTSSNAKRALRLGFRAAGSEGALPARPAPRPQHRGAASWACTVDDCVLYDPHKPGGGLTAQQLRDAKMILWRGHCSVHGRFTRTASTTSASGCRACNVLVHPECRYEVVTAADYVGSTEYIIQTIEAAPAGSAWAVGTELNLVRRLANAHPDKQITFLDRTVCYCSTMNRIDLPHLVWSLEELVAGACLNQITVDPDTARHARAALDRMLALPGLITLVMSLARKCTVV